MKETLLFLATPAVASILLAVMLGYFGNHILARGIIFIDIAIAQIAALGTLIGLLLGFAEQSVQIQVISYLVTLFVIGGFAFHRKKSRTIPSEAVIGIIYCLGLALAILFSEKIPGGSNYITKAITGNILWVTWKNVLILGLIFAGIGLVHLPVARDLQILSDHMDEGDPALRINSTLLNLLFYITFGVVVVKAVQIGGIFLVFTLLIAPSVAASMFMKSWKGKLIWTWILGVTGTLSGILLSYFLNISNGPAIVCLLGLLAFGQALLRLFRPSKT